VSSLTQKFKSASSHGLKLLSFFEEEPATRVRRNKLLHGSLSYVLTLARATLPDFSSRARCSKGARLIKHGWNYSSSTQDLIDRSETSGVHSRHVRQSTEHPQNSSFHW
jgi:hypothetical protein